MVKRYGTAILGQFEVRIEMMSNRRMPLLQFEFLLRREENLARVQPRRFRVGAECA